jgi:hypothetical protein
MKKSNTTLNYSPHLKEIMAEIRAILMKHDIASYILLQEPGFSEYAIAIEPTWSVLQLKKNGIHIRSKLADDFGGDKNAQHEANESTASLVRHFADILARDGKLFEDIHSILLAHWEITHTQGVSTPHKPQ